MRCYIDQLPPFAVGFKSENEARKLIIDVTAWKAEHPDMWFEIFVELPEQPGVQYPAPVTLDGNELTWLVTDEFTATVGDGLYEVFGHSGEVLKRTGSQTLSIMGSGLTMESPEAEVPDVSKPWVDQVLAARAEIAAAQKETTEQAEVAAQHAADAQDAADSAKGIIEDAVEDMNAASARAEAAADAANEAAANVEDGGYYEPVVSSSGLLAWWPSKEGMPFPDAVNIQGPRGLTGATGGTPTFTISRVENGTSVKISTPSVPNPGMPDTPGTFQFFTIPDGEKGEKGDPADPPIVPVIEGDVVSLLDSTDRALREFVLYGRSEQYKTTGAQLFNASKIKNTSNVNADLTADTIKLTVASEGQYRQTTDIAFRHFNTAGEKATISISYELLKRSNPANNVYLVVYWYKDKKKIEGYNALVAMEYPARSTTFTATAPVDDCDLGLIVCVNKANTAAVGDSMIIKNLMVSESDEPVPYEPYTGGAPSPSPSYPQGITSIGAVGDVKVSAKAGLPEGGNEHITIITQPRSVTAPVGTIIRFSAEAMGEGLTYQWIFQTKTGSTWTNSSVDDAKTKAMTMRVQSHQDGFKYCCKITDENGNAVTTDIATLTIGEPTVTENPVTVQTATIATPDGFPGVPVDSGGNYTDADGQQWIADTIEYNADAGTAKYVKRTGCMTFDGSSDENWILAGGGKYFASKGKDIALQVGAVCSHAAYNKYVISGSTGYSPPNDQYHRVRPKNFADITLDDWVALLGASPMTVVYPIATPVETDLSAEEAAAIAALRTHYPQTTIYNDEGAYMAVGYVADTKNYIDRKIEALAAAMLNRI